jgi:hypothetical protein
VYLDGAPQDCRGLIYRCLNHSDLAARKIDRFRKFRLSGVDERVRAGGADAPEDENEPKRLLWPSAT